MGDNQGWSAGRGILNAGARRPEHAVWPHVPIHARIVWADTGLQEWIETNAVGWAGDLVYVDMRRTDYSTGCSVNVPAAMAAPC